MDDFESIAACQKGEKDAFRHLVERYQRQAVGHAIAILGNREDALDAVQDAFIDAYRSLKNFDNSRPYYPWYYVLLRNRCYKLVSKRREAESIDENTFILAPRSGIGVEETIELEKAVRSLSSDDREIITLKYLDGLSYDELSDLLQIPKGTVMSRLFHARRAMQAKLTGKFNR
jgi:RNA polymerase sigma-70 factor (ECF subfamily)